MATRKTGTKTGARSVEAVCPTCGRRRRDRSVALLEKLLVKVGKELTTGTLKASVADYLRLLQFREEMKGDEPPKEIRVTWVEPGGNSESGE